MTVFAVFDDVFVNGWANPRWHEARIAFTVRRSCDIIADMMNTPAISLLAPVLYILGGLLLLRRLGKGQIGSSKTGILALAVVALILHAGMLYQGVLRPGGLNLGFFNALSLASWLIVLLLVLTSLRKPIENLGIVLFPFAAISVILDLVYPADHLIVIDSWQKQTHILTSLLAYSLFAMAAVQAILLAIQNRHLHNRRPGGFIRALPPLKTMETLLFQLIGVGFVLLSISLLTGFFFVENLFAQHLAHKTILSLVSWVLFGILLWGRIRFGWRGRTAIRWTLGGFVMLLLAYFGSRFVLDLILR